MSDQYKFNNPDGIFFTTTTVIDWIDVFIRKEYKFIIIDSLTHCINNKGLVIHAWCLMSSHLHMIISRKGELNLSGIMRDFKKFTSKEIVKTIAEVNESRKYWLMNRFEYAAKYTKRNKDFKFWQDGNHPEELISNEFIDQKLNYIHNNPVEEMIVSEPEDYLFSSARDYAGIKGLIDVDFLD